MSHKMGISIVKNIRLHKETLTQLFKIPTESANLILIAKDLPLFQALSIKLQISKQLLLQKKNFLLYLNVLIKIHFLKMKFNKNKKIFKPNAIIYFSTNSYYKGNKKVNKFLIVIFK